MKNAGRMYFTTKRSSTYKPCVMWFYLEVQEQKYAKENSF